jgi:hypothetical protein
MTFFIKEPLGSRVGGEARASPSIYRACTVSSQSLRTKLQNVYKEKCYATTCKPPQTFSTSSSVKDTYPGYMTEMTRQAHTESA